MNKIVVVGASAGGIPALQTIVSQLPADFPAPILVVVHVSGSHESVLPKILTRSGELEAVHPYNGERIQPGKIFVAPPNYHMVVIDHHIQLKSTHKENLHRPAVDPLFRSAARSHGDKVIGIILSGVLDDGTGGLIDIKRHNGIAVVQDPDDAMFASMPESACRYVDVDFALSAQEIGAQLTHMVAEVIQAMDEPNKQQTAPQNTIDIIDSTEVMLHDMHDQPGEVTPYACPECNGNLWVSQEDGFDKYWCHIGHRYTKRTLLAEKSRKIEAMLFEAMRNLKEGVALGREALEYATHLLDQVNRDELEREVHLREKQLQSLQQIIGES